MPKGVYRWFGLILIGVVLISGTFLFIGTTEGKTITVDDDEGANFTSVQEAIDSSEDGDVIRIHSGTYHETIRVNKSVSLEGNSSDETILDGSGFSTVVLIKAEGVGIRNCTITGTGDGNAGSGIEVERNGALIIDNHIMDNDGVGILLRKSKMCEIRGNTIGNNRVNGIRYYNADGTIVEGNEFSDVRNGIDGSSSRGIEIRENTFTNCTTGIELIDPWDHQIADNHFSMYTTGLSINKDEKREVVLIGNTYDGSGTDVKYYEHEICDGHSDETNMVLFVVWIAPIAGALTARKALANKRGKASDSIAYHYIFIVGWTAFCLWLYIYTW